MTTTRNDLLRGTLEMLVLKTLSWGSLHGYGIARLLEQRTGDILQIEEGSMYPALYRLEAADFITAAWGKSEVGRRAKFYSLTPTGRARLCEQADQWQAFAQAVSAVMVAEA